jgi:hypothetical protein
MTTQEKVDTHPAERPSLFGARKWILWVALGIIFCVGLGIRLFDLTDAPLDFHSTRQLHSAMISRGMYYQDLASAPQWQRDTAVQQMKGEGLIEPQIMEWLTAQGYKVVGSAQLWIARLYSILFWMAGSIALFLLAREIAGTDGAVVGMVYFLVLPYGVIASRAFQPDPLMTALLIFSLWAMVRYNRTPTWKWALIAGALAGATILVKSVAVFMIGGAWIGIVLFGSGLRKAIRDPKIYAAAALTVVPYIIFHIYGVYVVKTLESEFSLRFFPNLWTDLTWYLRWKGQIATVVGFEWFLIALVGTIAIKDRAHRAMILGAWAGYFALGMALSFHISTHDYYTEPLIPVVALGLAAGADVLIRNLRGPKALQYIALIGVILFAVVTESWDSIVTLKRVDYSNEVTFWEKLGTKLGHDASVVGLTQDYGFRLAYYGWLTPVNWMTSGDFAYRELAGSRFDNIKSLFDEQTAGKDYFLVTLFNELDSQPELKQILAGYTVAEQTDDYILYDLRKPLQSTPGS